MIGIPMYIAYWASLNRIEHKLSYGGLEPQKIPSVYIRGPPYTAIRMSSKEPEQNVSEGTRTECP